MGRQGAGVEEPRSVSGRMEGNYRKLGILSDCEKTPYKKVAIRKSRLYGVGRFDPLVLGGAISVLLACALVAAILPARRAASIEPVRALKTE